MNLAVTQVTDLSPLGNDRQPRFVHERGARLMPFQVQQADPWQSRGVHSFPSNQGKKALSKGVARSGGSGHGGSRGETVISSFRTIVTFLRAFLLFYYAFMEK